MTRPILSLLLFVLALSPLRALDLIRPLVALEETASGIKVVLDFSRIPAEKWQLMLSDPNRFQEYGYGLSGNPGQAALPQLTQVIPVVNLHTPVLEEVHWRSGPEINVQLKARPAGHLDSDPEPQLVQTWSREATLETIEPELLLGDPIHAGGHLLLPLSFKPLGITADGSIVLPSLLEFTIRNAHLDPGLSLNRQGDLRSIRLIEERYVPKGRYLIITPAVFESYLAPLVTWKREQGYEVDLVTTLQTGGTASGIKNYIQGIWDQGEARPDYLLIVGDEDQGIPGHYIQNPQGDNLVTDHPYALMEGDDSFPEIMVGRLSVDTVSELAAFMAKIIRYESTPYLDEPEWFTEALMVCTSTGAASALATKEWVASKMEENDFTQIHTAYHPEQSSSYYIANPINMGVGYVNYRGFGMYNGWFGPDFTSSDIYSLINNGAKTPVITSVVCGGGNFAAWEDPCFGEVWTRIGTSSVPRGAVAFFGPSELYTHTQFNNVIDIGIYSGIFDQDLTTLGDALWNGKFELWRNYHENVYFPFGQTPEFYHHIYNLLGDPGMQLWTDVPELPQVIHAPWRSVEDHGLFVSVSDQAGNSVEHAYVSLYSSQYHIGGWTDASGEITLPLEFNQTGSIKITVTGKNLFPYTAQIPIQEDVRPLIVEAWSLGQGQMLEAGSTQAMEIEISNPGEDVNNVTLSFTSSHPGVMVTDQLQIPTFPSLATEIITSAFLSVDPAVQHGTPVDIQMEVFADGIRWFVLEQFMVQAPRLEVSELHVLSGTLSADDSAMVAIHLLNSGGAACPEFTLTPLENTLVSWNTGPISCASVDIDAALILDDQIQLNLSDQVFHGEFLTLDFQCDFGDRQDTISARIQAGEVSPYGPSQRDEYGYRMFDNMDLSYTKAQSYDWIEIDPDEGGSGSGLSLNDYFEEDDASTVMQLPFPVTYYGQTYDQITVCSNGWAAFGAQSVVDFHNRIIPSPIGPTAMLAPYWDDLITNGGAILYDVQQNGQVFILEWNHLRHLYHSGRVSFQILLFNTDAYPTDSGDNDIKFQYKQYVSQDVAANFNTIGIESPNYQDGILVTYNGSQEASITGLEPQVALLFTTDRGERLAAAVAAISQMNMSFVQNPWTSASDSIVITNVGESPLAYSISMDESVQAPEAPDMPQLDPRLTKSSPDPDPASGSERDGVDAFGYTWQNSNEDGGPPYSWIDIESPENVLPYGNDPDDGSVGPVDLGFEFPFYDEVYSQIYVGSNGTLSFESTDSPWYNNIIPSPGSPAALIAPFWEDLNSDGGPLGTLYFWTNEFNQCIITYKDFPKWGTVDTYTFQVVLEAFGKITFQYQELNGPTSSVTVGIQNAAGNMGLQILHNELTPWPAEMAVTIRRPVDWFTASNWSGTIPGGESRTFHVDIQTQSLDPGHYEVPMTLRTSASNLSEAQLLLTLDVVLGQPPPGDVNHDYLVNMNDLMKMLDFILLIEDMNEEQFGLADISADQSVDIIDVVLLLEAILNTE